MMKIIHILLLALIISACSPHDSSFNIDFHNTSDYTLCVDFDCVYPDDSVSTISEVMRQVSIPFIIKPHSQMDVWHGAEKKQSWYAYFDVSENGFVSFYIIDVKVKNEGNVEKTLREYNVLARYDVTIEDLESLNWSLAYPPTAEMSIIHMYLAQ